MRTEYHKEYQQEVEAEHECYNYPETLLHTVLVGMTVVIAHHRDKSLGKTDERYTGKLHGTLHDGKGTDINIAKMFQTSVKYETYKAFRTCHNKR